MKVKIFREDDEPTNDWSYCKIGLEERINSFIKDKKVIDIKYQTNLSGYANETAHAVEDCERALVMYEEKRNSHLQQEEFNISNGEDPNEFMKNRDVVNVATFKDENSELMTVVTYEDEDND